MSKDAAKEGREACKAGKPRKSPYDGIRLLRGLSRSWYDGWDAMRVIENETQQGGLTCD